MGSGLVNIPHVGITEPQAADQPTGAILDPAKALVKKGASTDGRTEKRTKGNRIKRLRTARLNGPLNRLRRYFMRGIIDLRTARLKVPLDYCARWGAGVASACESE